MLPSNLCAHGCKEAQMVGNRRMMGCKVLVRWAPGTSWAFLLSLMHLIPGNVRKNRPGPWSAWIPLLIWGSAELMRQVQHPAHQSDPSICPHRLHLHHHLSPIEVVTLLVHHQPLWLLLQRAQGRQLVPRHIHGKVLSRSPLALLSTQGALYAILLIQTRGLRSYQAQSKEGLKL